MARPVSGRQLQFVIKISKYCNLRCRYCYEYEELDNRQRMSCEQVAALFENVASALAHEDVAEIDFIWHGGEPLLVPLDVYEELGRLQRQVFGEHARVKNSLQTNLTILTPRHLAFLREGRFFTDIGVSFDVCGNQRIDLRGDQRRERIIRNMQTLLDHGVPFAAIAVLCQDTRRFVRDIYNFYDGLRLPFRLLPIDSESYSGQADKHAVSGDETVAAMLELFDSFRSSPSATPAEPIDGYLDYALAHLGGRVLGHYDKPGEESIFVVDLDGALYGVADAYCEGYRYGNIFEEDFETCWTSPARKHALDDARARHDRHCVACPYFGACPGFYVGDAEPVQRGLLESFGCPVRGILDGMVERLEEVADCLEPELQRVAALDR